MYTPEYIMNLIQDDAPCVYDILMEEYFRTTENKWVFPIPDQLLDILKEYSGDNHEVHYWAGRYAQMIEDHRNQEPIRVPFTEADINNLQEWEYFTWTYWGRQLFIFNTDSTPQFDPDSDEYDPTLTV